MTEFERKIVALSLNYELDFLSLTNSIDHENDLEKFDCRSRNLRSKFINNIILLIEKFKMKEKLVCTEK